MISGRLGSGIDEMLDLLIYNVITPLCSFMAWLDSMPILQGVKHRVLGAYLYSNSTPPYVSGCTVGSCTDTVKARGKTAWVWGCVEAGVYVDMDVGVDMGVDVDIGVGVDVGVEMGWMGWMDGWIGWGNAGTR